MARNDPHDEHISQLEVGDYRAWRKFTQQGYELEHAQGQTATRYNSFALFAGCLVTALYYYVWVMAVDGPSFDMKAALFALIAGVLVWQSRVILRAMIGFFLLSLALAIAEALTSGGSRSVHDVFVAHLAYLIHAILALYDIIPGLGR